MAIKLNPMCIYSETNSCTHPECHRMHIPFLSSQSYDSLIIHKLYDLVQAQTVNLKKIADENKVLLTSIDSLSCKIPKLSQQSEPCLSLAPQINSTLSQILREDASQYSILLIGALPSNILKEKGFQITVGLIDANQNRVQIPSDFKFKVELYTMDTPSKLLESNIHGKKILRGTLFALTTDNWTVNFSNIVINEVSSHYSNDSLKIVVQLIGSHIVKPLFINNISVRARKAR